MNEEMRKEFEKFIFDFLGKDVSENRSKTPNGIDGYVFDDDDSTALCTMCWMSWQASREAMKPIKLPNEIEIDLIGDMVANSHQNSYSEGYNDALKDVETAINEAGYKVAP